MLTDLGGLRLVLPESVAVKHLLGDVHQQLGQWEFARSSYLEVIDAEPGNAAAMNDLGAFYFRVGDHASAIQLFQRASGDDTVAAAAFFNLSQAYSAGYHFDESSQMLALARRADESAVSGWLQLSEAARVVTVFGGLERVDEVRAELLEVWHPSEARQSLGAALLGAMSFRLAIIVIVLAMVLERLGRGWGFYRKRPDAPAKAREPDDSLRRILVPGMAAAIDGHGERAFGELLLPVALLTLPLVGMIGYRIPWGYDPGGLVVWAISGFGMLAYLSRRVIRGLGS
jgi:tetratricopeptide (TPR) repeat protein